MLFKEKSEKGFALILSMVMLLAMTLMGSVLLMNASSQSKVTGKSERSRQTFLSAETGVEAARRWLSIEAATGNLPKTNSFESKIDSNMFDPTKNSPPNEWLQKLQSRIDEYYNKELNKIKKAVILGNELGLEVHAGHGLTYKSAKILKKVKGVNYCKHRVNITETGKIIPARMTGTSAKYQRQLNKAVKRARHLSLIPYTDSHYN